MALIKCPRCGKEISDKAKICPICSINFKEYEEEQKKLRQIEHEKKQKLLQEEERQKKLQEQKRIEEERKKMENKRICPECGEIIDKSASVCPKCAYPIKEEDEKKQSEKEYMRNCMICVASVSFILLFAFMIYYNETTLLNRDQTGSNVSYKSETNYDSDEDYDESDEDYDDSDDYEDTEDYADDSDDYYEDAYEEEEEKEPYIGMSAYDAEFNCTWGSPQDKNITETQYGKEEQWVYGGNHYLYIENNKVVAIQQ